MRDFSGKILDNHYKLKSKIGEGATSEVYLATDLQIGATWAVKVIDKGNSIQKKDYERQKSEALLLSKLSHPLFPRVLPTLYDQEGYLFIVMDYIQGITLTERAKNAITLTEIIDIIKQICNGIDYLHHQGYAYCDLKPDNIIINDGQISIIDVGAVLKIGDTRSIRNGNKGFSAPEYFYGQNGIKVPVGRYTDIYSIGKIFLWLLQSGKYKEVSGQLIDIIEKCTNENISERYNNCRLIIESLKKYERQNDPGSKYRFKFIVFIICVVISILGFIIGGAAYYSCILEYTSVGENYLNQAIKMEQEGDVNNAIEAYLNAIGKQPEIQDTYYKIYELMNPTPSENYEEQIRQRIDIFRERTHVKYLPEDLRLLLAESCIEQSNQVYIDYANKLLKGIDHPKAKILLQIFDEKMNYESLYTELNQLISSTENTDDKIDYLYLLSVVITKNGSWNTKDAEMIQECIDKLDPEESENNIKLIQTYKIIAIGLSQSNDMKEQAISWWEKLDEWSSVFTKEDYKIEGDVYYENGQLDDALKCYENVIRSDPSDINGYIDAINVAIDKNDKEQSLKYWKTILDYKENENDKLTVNIIKQINSIETEMKLKGYIE